MAVLQALQSLGFLLLPFSPLLCLKTSTTQCQQLSLNELHPNRGTVLTGIEGFGGALQHFKGQGRHNVSLACDGAGSLHRFAAQGGDHLCPIDECQALWGGGETFPTVL